MLLTMALALVTVVEAPKTAPEVHVGASAARAILAGCGPVSKELTRLPDVAWTDRPSARTDHASLRAALAEPMPEAATQISFYATGGHLADEWHSVVLVRDRVGTWAGTAVGRSRIWVAGAPMQPARRDAWTLSRADGEQVDRIIADRCFHAEPTSGWDDPAVGPPPRGGLSIEFEVVTPQRTRRAWFLGGRARGLTAELFALVVPK